jgi:hypothetical protein
MRVLQQMFAPRAQVLINCRRHVLHAVAGARHAALQVLSAFLALMDIISMGTRRRVHHVGSVLKRALQTPLTLYATLNFS